MSCIQFTGYLFVGLGHWTGKPGGAETGRGYQPDICGLGVSARQHRYAHCCGLIADGVARRSVVISFVGCSSSLVWRLVH